MTNFSHVQSLPTIIHVETKQEWRQYTTLLNTIGNAKKKDNHPTTLPDTDSRQDIVSTAFLLFYLTFIFISIFIFIFIFTFFYYYIFFFNLLCFFFQCFTPEVIPPLCVTVNEVVTVQQHSFSALLYERHFNLRKYVLPLPKRPSTDTLSMQKRPHS